MQITKAQAREVMSHPCPTCGAAAVRRKTSGDVAELILRANVSAKRMETKDLYKICREQGIHPETLLDKAKEMGMKVERTGARDKQKYYLGPIPKWTK